MPASAPGDISPAPPRSQRGARPVGRSLVLGVVEGAPVLHRLEVRLDLRLQLEQLPHRLLARLGVERQVLARRRLGQVELGAVGELRVRGWG